MECTCWRVSADNTTDCGWCGTGRYSLDSQVSAIIDDVRWFLDILDLEEAR